MEHYHRSLLRRCFVSLIRSICLKTSPSIIQSHFFLKWKETVNQSKYETHLLKKAQSSIKDCRTVYSLNQWQKAVYNSLYIYAFRLHHIHNYCRTTNNLSLSSSKSSSPTTTIFLLWLLPLRFWFQQHHYSSLNLIYFFQKWRLYKNRRKSWIRISFDTNKTYKWNTRNIIFHRWLTIAKLKIHSKNRYDIKQQIPSLKVWNKHYGQCLLAEDDDFFQDYFWNRRPSIIPDDYYGPKLLLLIERPLFLFVNDTILIWYQIIIMYINKYKIELNRRIENSKSDPVECIYLQRKKNRLHKTKEYLIQVIQTYGIHLDNGFSINEHNDELLPQSNTFHPNQHCKSFQVELLPTHDNDGNSSHLNTQDFIASSRRKVLLETAKQWWHTELSKQQEEGGDAIHLNNILLWIVLTKSKISCNSELSLKKTTYHQSSQQQPQQLQECDANETNDKNSDEVIEHVKRVIDSNNQLKQSSLEKCEYMVKASKNEWLQYERKHQMNKKLLDHCIYDLRNHCCICGGVHLEQTKMKQEEYHNLSQVPGCKKLRLKRIRKKCLERNLLESSWTLQMLKIQFREHQSSAEGAKVKKKVNMEQGKMLIDSLSSNLYFK